MVSSPREVDTLRLKDAKDDGIANQSKGGINLLYPRLRQRPVRKPHNLHYDKFLEVELKSSF
jgi:hypothetical protein